MAYVRKYTSNAGRTSKFKPEMAEQIYRLALLGLKDQKIAEFLEVNEATLNNWKNNYPAVKKAFYRGRTESNLKVVEALYDRAVGYQHPDCTILTKTIKHYDDDGKVISSETVPMIVPTIKYYPPDSYAALKILAIRQREEWTDITKIEHSISADINVNYLLEMISDKTIFSEADLHQALQTSIEERLKPQDAQNN